MIFSEKMQKAVNVSAMMHNGQFRRFILRPYSVHPVSVAFILAQYTEDEDVLMAGLLHDVLEDTAYTEDDMRMEFGDRVTDIVKEVSEDNAVKISLGVTQSWKVRKEMYIGALGSASIEAVMVAAADKIQNLRSLREGLTVVGQSAGWPFNASRDDMRWFYGTVVETIAHRLGTHGLVGELTQAWLEVEPIFGGVVGEGQIVPASATVSLGESVEA